MKFNDNASSGSRGVPCGRIDGQTDMTNLIVAFNNFVNLSKNITSHTTNRPPLAVAEDNSVMEKFLIPKLHDSKIANLIILGSKLKDNVCVTFPEVVPNLTKKYFDMFIVIYCLRVKMALKEGTSPIQSNTRKIANVVSNSGRKISVLSSYWTTGKFVFSKLLSLICSGTSAGLTWCHIVKDPAIILGHSDLFIFIQFTFFVGILLNLFYCTFVYCYYKIFWFQAWGDYASMSQGLALNVIFVCEVLLICWFGTQLTQHVRVKGLILLLYLQRHVENSESFQQSSFKLWILLCNFWPFIAKIEKKKYKFHNFRRFNYSN